MYHVFLFCFVIFKVTKKKTRQSCEQICEYSPQQPSHRNKKRVAILAILDILLTEPYERVM